jgi:hypothetical protein
MIKILIHKNIYFLVILSINILFLIFGTLQDLIYVSYFAVVSQLTRQCAEGLTQPRVLNNLYLKKDKSIIYFSEVSVTAGFSCITASILAYSLELDLLTFLSTLPLMVVIILLQPSLSQLNKEGNYSKWNTVLIIPELISFLIFVLANQYSMEIAVHLKYLTQSALLLILNFLFKMPFPTLEWQSPRKMKDIRISVIANIISKNLDKFIVGFVLIAPDFMVYERVVYFVKALTSVCFQPLNIWVQNRSRNLENIHINSFLRAFMNYSLFISFLMAIIFVIISINIVTQINETSATILLFFILALPIFVLAAPVSCTSGFLYALGKVRLVKEMTIAHFSYSLALYAGAFFVIKDVKSAVIVLVISYSLNYSMVLYFLTKGNVLNIYFTCKQIISAVVISGILLWIS